MPSGPVACNCGGEAIIRPTRLAGNGAASVSFTSGSSLETSNEVPLLPLDRILKIGTIRP